MKQIMQINITNLNQEEDQLAIYKRGRGVELGTTEKLLQLSGTWT